MNRSVRVAVGIILLALGGFCGFGFLASKETEGTRRLAWQTGYAIVGLVSLGIGGWLLRHRNHQ